jgi:molybdenum cofactor biosynthesis protein B
MSTVDHQKARVDSVACAVLTVSDTRTEATDESGRLIRERLTGAGHRVVRHEIVRDELVQVRSLVEAICAEQAVQAVLLTGGTGIAVRDTTFEAVAPLLEKRLDGFGELFRMLSFRDIGAPALLSRAVAGVRERTVIFVMPGSTAAVRLAMDELILPVLGHTAGLLRP